MSTSETTPIPTAEPVRFGTFTGVFTPTLLTILGVIMYVRLGWVVGNAGLLGAWAIMFVGLVITLCTGLSLSSIATNTRLGAGGPYAIVSRSLGLEVAGSVGIPLYLTRPLGIAMYIFGFREGVQWFFPDVNAFFVDVVVFLGLFAIAFASADLAFKVQYVIMAVIAASIVSIFAGSPTSTPVVETTWIGEYPGFPETEFQGTSFWGVFAVFFPATTGILAGANMSGDLKDSRTSIASGTLWAIGISAVIYFAIAWWAARAGSMRELAENYNAIIDNAAVPSLVLAGLLGATASSALAGMVGGPRILMAMGEDKLLPASAWIAKTTASGEPRNASVVTGVLTFACLMLRDLNAIAPLVTMFFLITYCVINVVVLFEQGLGLVSFRPTLKVPLFVPLIGTVGSIFAMMVVNPTMGFLAIVMVIGVYIWIDRFVEIDQNSTEEARSSVFFALAEFAASKASDLSAHSVRAWKPNMLVPFENPEHVRGSFDLISDACAPEGGVTLLALATSETTEALTPRVLELEAAFQQKGLRTSWAAIDTADYATGTSAGLQALQSAFFRPNLLFLEAPSDPARSAEAAELVTLARRTQVGAFVVVRHAEAGLGQRRLVTLWVRAGDTDLTETFQGRNLNLTLLMGYRLARVWGARLRLVTAAREDTHVEDSLHFLTELVDVARLPRDTECLVEVGSFDEVMKRLSVSDLNILGLQPSPDFEALHAIVRSARSTCLFVADSGRESAMS